MNPKTILGEWNNELYIYKDDYSSQGVQHYMSLETYSLPEMILTTSTEFKLPDINERGSTTIINMFMVKGNIILFFDNEKVKMGKPYAKVKETEYKCYGAILDKKGKVIGEPVILYEELWEEDVRETNGPSTPKCNVLLSSDTNNFFLYSGNIKNSKLPGKMLDSKLTVLSTHFLELPFTKSFSLSNLMLDEEQNFYFLSKESTFEPKKFTYKIFAFDLKNKTAKNKVLPVKTTFPLSPPYMSKHRSKLQIVTYYYDAVKIKAKGGGTLFYEFNVSDLEMVTSFESEFDAVAVTQLNSNSKFLKTYNYDDNDNAINTLLNSKIVNTPSGEKYIISEQVISLYLATTYGQDYFNIIVTKVNKNGLAAKPCVIPKLQSGKAKAYYSFIDIVKNNQLYLIYNDNAKNLDTADPYDIDRGLTGLSGSTAILVTINDKGGWNKKSLYKVDEKTAYIYPTKYYCNKLNQMVFYGQFENKIRFGIIKL